MDITALLATTPTNLFIDGEFVPSDTNDTFPVINPSDGMELARVASASEADARRALAAAVRAPIGRTLPAGSAAPFCTALSNSFSTTGRSWPGCNPWNSAGPCPIAAPR